MFRYTNHVCKKCFLQNDPFHKVTLNEDGVCSLCAKPAPEEARRDWDALEKALDMDALMKILEGGAG